MKKFILEILLGLGLSATIFHIQTGGKLSAEKPVNKQINLYVSRDSSYNSATYDATIASVYVVVFKSVAHKQTILWQKAYNAMQLKNYPVNNSVLRQVVTIKNVKESREKLYITYRVTYTTRGNSLKIENGTCLEKGEKKGDVMINM